MKLMTVATSTKHEISAAIHPSCLPADRPLNRRSIPNLILNLMTGPLNHTVVLQVLLDPCTGINAKLVAQQQEYDHQDHAESRSHVSDKQY